jgi:hypothetical protein
VIGWDLDRPSEITVEGGIDDPGLAAKEYDTKYDDPSWSRKGDFAFTPQLPTDSTSGIRLADESELVTLVPYGCAKLRLTIFPRVDRIAGGAHSESEPNQKVFINDQELDESA